jgi:hypothetical protein
LIRKVYLEVTIGLAECDGMMKVGFFFELQRMRTGRSGNVASHHQVPDLAVEGIDTDDIRSRRRLAAASGILFDDRHSLETWDGRTLQSRHSFTQIRTQPSAKSTSIKTATVPAQPSENAARYT